MSDRQKQKKSETDLGSIPVPPKTEDEGRIHKPTDEDVKRYDTKTQQLIRIVSTLSPGIEHLSKVLLIFCVLVTLAFGVAVVLPMNVREQLRELLASIIGGLASTIDVIAKPLRRMF